MEDLTMSGNEGRRHHEASGFEDRRKRTDWITYMATILGVVSWIVAFSVGLLLDLASPEREHMFSRMFGTSVRNYWDPALLPIAFGLLVASFCICCLALLFNALRKRRKTDRFKKPVIVIGIVTFVGILFFIYRFGAYFLW